MPLYYRKYDPRAINQKYPYEKRPVRWYSWSDWVAYFTGGK